MYRFSIIAVCCLIFCGTFCSANTQPARPRKQKFDWQKAEGERKKMREKIREEHKKYIEKLNEFHKRFLQAETETEKNAVRAELDSFLRKDFERKIEHSKKRIENMKKFVAKLEEEQKNMEAGAQNMIKKRTEEVLQGRIIPAHRKNPAGK
jgi:hypothetical protein